jgi:hypothetical protein
VENLMGGVSNVVSASAGAEEEAVPGRVSGVEPKPVKA